MWQQQLVGMTGALGSALSAIAKQAGIVFTHLWVILTYQQFLIGVQMMLTGLGLFFLGLIALRLILLVKSKTNWAVMDRVAIIGVLTIVLIVSIINGFQLGVASLPHMLNPQYYALENAVQMLQAIRK